MAALALSPTFNGGPRGGSEPMSAILPAITCSTCGDQISLNSLGDHVCGSSNGRSSATKQPTRNRSRTGSRSDSRMAQPQRTMGAATFSTSPPLPQQQAPPLVAPTPVVPDTRAGGSSGMAGVGRRAFAAAAWAAVAVQNSTTSVGQTSAPPPQPSPTNLVPPWAEPPRPITPPYAHFGRSNSPALEEAQNQSQPYFIASHGLREQREKEREREMEKERAKERGIQQGRERAKWEAEQRREKEVWEYREKERLRKEQDATVVQKQVETRRRAEEEERRQKQEEEDSRSHSRQRSRDMSGISANRRPSVKRTVSNQTEQDRRYQQQESRPPVSRSMTTPGNWDSTSNGSSRTSGSVRREIAPISSTTVRDASSTSSTPMASGSKLPFFERYKKMLDGATTSASASLSRSLSGTKHNITASPSMSDDDEVESPMAIFSGASAIKGASSKNTSYKDDDDSALPWARNDDEREVLQEQVSLPSRSDRHLRPASVVTSKHTRSANGSVSSLESASADKLRLGETALLTPSGSMDRLDQVPAAEVKMETTAVVPRNESTKQRSPRSKRGLSSRKQSTADDDEVYTFSPNPGFDVRTTRTGGDHDSFRSSMLAPSDSVSLMMPSNADGRKRSNTITKSDVRPSGRGGKRCQKCGDDLHGRRFIERDGVSLCERDWKEMFLPKCRRCSLPIETAAVSSSDGQLKGKWHRDCFTCADCDRPFEGNVFYVHDDKPYCQLHYHKLNGTLCSASSCGKPIEGPCLVTPTNQRYHPGHFRCDHRAPSGQQDCQDGMQDYYEVGRLRVCERHKDEAVRLVNKFNSKNGRAGEAASGGGAGMAKVEKRRTRIVNA